MERLLTVKELLRLPEDGKDRWLIRGQLREKPKTYHDREHSRIVPTIAYLLGRWLDHQPEPRGDLFSGEVGCILARDPDTLVGIDVVYSSPKQAAEQTEYLEGPPVLAVEVIDVSDSFAEIQEKVDEYLKVGIPLVWVIDPACRTLAVHRPNAVPMLLDCSRETTGDPHLPGFTLRVADIFED
jgi:Uma2 family endonuclease